MQRCTKCVMPETVPGITFDSDGVCSYCLDYEKESYKGVTELKELVKRVRRDDVRYDCVVPLSGGRDSTYVLYYVVKELGLRTLAVHHDNDFATPQAKENMRNACDRLGVDLEVVDAGRHIGRNMARYGMRTAIPLGMAEFCNSFCHACLYGARAAVIRAAEREQAPLVFAGMSKGEATEGMEAEAFQGKRPSKWLKLINPSFYQFEYH